MEEITGKYLIENELIIDFDKREMCTLSSDKKPVPVTDKKYDILCYLWHNQDRPMNTDQIFQYVWNDSPEIEDSNHTVMQAISTLKGWIADLVGKEIADQFISNRRGVGYIIDSEKVKCEPVRDNQANAGNNGIGTLNIDHSDFHDNGNIFAGTIFNGPVHFDSTPDSKKK